MGKSTSVKLALLSASLSFIGATLGIIAFGLPYWILFDDVIVVSISGTSSHVRMRFHYGFWRYCNDVSTSIQSLNNCGTVKSHTDLEQLTICLAMLSLVLSVNAFINTCLYLCLMKNEKLCLYVTAVSAIISGLTMAAAVINYGVQDHTARITHSFTLPFTVANLSTSFWLSIADSITICISAVITVISLYYHTNKTTGYRVSIMSLEDDNYARNLELQANARYIGTDGLHNHSTYKTNSHYVFHDENSDNLPTDEENIQKTLVVDINDRNPWKLDEIDVPWETNNTKTSNEQRSNKDRNENTRYETVYVCQGLLNGENDKAVNLFTNHVNNAFVMDKNKPRVPNSTSVSSIYKGNRLLSGTSNVGGQDSPQRNTPLPAIRESDKQEPVTDIDSHSNVSEHFNSQHTLVTSSPESSTSDIVSQRSPRQSSFAMRLQKRKMQASRKMIPVNVDPALHVDRLGQEQERSLDLSSADSFKSQSNILKTGIRSNVVSDISPPTFDTTLGNLSHELGQPLTVKRLAGSVKYNETNSNNKSEKSLSKPMLIRRTYFSPHETDSIQINTDNAYTSMQETNTSDLVKYDTNSDIHFLLKYDSPKVTDRNEEEMKNKELNVTMPPDIQKKKANTSHGLKASYTSDISLSKECFIRYKTVPVNEDSSRDISIPKHTSISVEQHSSVRKVTESIKNEAITELSDLGPEPKKDIVKKAGSKSLKQRCIGRVPRAYNVDKQDLFRNLAKVHTESSVAKIDTTNSTSGPSPLGIKSTKRGLGPTLLNPFPNTDDM